MARFSEQYKRKFRQKTIHPVIHMEETYVCVELDGTLRMDAEAVGSELTNMMMCSSYAVEWNGQNDLYLHDFDFAMVTSTELSRTLAHLLEAYGYLVDDIEINC
ncbi:MAG: hypothetical protein ACI4C3_10665 [Bacteroides sp.]